MSFFSRVHTHRKSVFSVSLLLAAAGVALMLQLPVSLFPDITFPRIVILADNGEEPADRMMASVTKPIEEVVSSLPGLRTERSLTSRGSAEISIFLNWGVNVQQALQLLQGRLANISNILPPTAHINAEAMSVAVFPIEGYSLTSKTRSLVELRDIAVYQLRPQLLRVPGVQRVEVTGGDTRDFEVRVDPNKLYQYKLDIRQVADALRLTNFISSTGMLDNNYQLYLSLVTGLLKTADDISAVTVTTLNGSPIRIGDVATVTPNVEDRTIRTTAHGRDAVLINILKQPTGSTVQIGQDVQSVLRTIKLPSDVSFENFYDQATYISDSISSTRDSIVIGIVLAMIVLLLFLRSWRITLVVALVVPITIAGTFVCLYTINETINIMTLGGIAAAVGLLIDDSIVIIEAIFTHFAIEQHEGGSKEEIYSRATGAALKTLMVAVISSTLSTIVIHIPLGFLSGITGAFFRSLSITMVFALILSFLFSITLAPLLAGGFVSARDIDREVKREDKRSRLSDYFERFMRGVLNNSWVTIPAVLLLLAASYFFYIKLGSGFMPEMDEGSFVLDYASPPGTSLTETNRMLTNVERVLMKIPEVAAYSRRTGTQLGFFLTEPNKGDYTVRLNQVRTRGINEVINEVRARVQQIEPRLTIDFGQILQDVIGDLTNTPMPIEVKVFGGDQMTLEKTANRVLELIQPVNGVVDAFNGIVIAGPSNMIEVDPQRSSFYNITTKDVQEQLQLMMAGVEPTSVLIGQKSVGIRVRFPAAYHFNLDSLGSLMLTSSKGTLVPLKAIATIYRTPGEAERDREGLEPFIAVTARIENRDLGSTINDIKSVLNAKLHLPTGMRIEYGGVYQTQQESFRSLLIVALIAFVLVFLVLLFTFREFRAAIAIILITILSLGGVFAALWVTNMTLNISSFVGLIMIIGIVAENAIFILYTAHLPRYSAMHPHDAIIGATHERMRPIAMTTLAAVLALLPLALALGAGAQMQQSLAIAVIGGFSVSTILLFVLLPGLYTLLSPRAMSSRSTGLETGGPSEST